MGLTTAGVIRLLIGIGLSIAAYQIQKRALDKRGSKLIDDKPPSTSLRGSWVPRIIGRRRIGPVIAWVGNRFVTNESLEGAGGKGASSKGGGATQTVYFESAWHILCVGPANILHSIYDNGKVIWAGPISPATHPSGSALDLGNIGTFKIFWGEEDQPLSAETNAAFGINSRWRNVCYIFWTNKKLGLAPNWSPLEYEIEVQPNNSKLTQSPRWFELPGFVPPTYNITSVLDGAPGVGFVQIKEDVVSEYPAGTQVEIQGQPNAGIFNIQSVTRENFVDSTDPTNRDLTTWDLAPAVTTTLTRTLDAGDVPPGETLPSGANSYELITPALPTVGSTAGIVNSIPQASFDTAKRYELQFYLKLPPGPDTSFSLFFHLGDTNSLITSAAIGLAWGDLLGFGEPDGQYNITTPPIWLLDTITLVGISSSLKEIGSNWYKVTIEFEPAQIPATGLGLKFLFFTLNPNTSLTVNMTSPVMFEEGESKLFFEETLTGLIADQGSVQQFISSGSPSSITASGANVAHTIYELMFSEFPHGAGLNTTNYDIDSLEQIGIQLSTNVEGIPGHSLAGDGMTVKDALTAIFQDLGIFLYYSHDLRKFQFKLLRENPSAIVLNDDIILNPIPELRIARGDKPVDRLSYAFQDEERNYRENTIDLGEDALAERNGAKVRKIPIFTTTNFDAAQKIADRREQEDALDSGALKFFAHRSARELIPGDTITPHGFNCPFKVMEVKPISNSAKVEISAVVDAYGIQGSGNILKQLLAQTDFNAIEDVQVGAAQMPWTLNTGSISKLIFPRIRENIFTIGAAIWTQSDALAESEFILRGTVTDVVTGGFCAENVSSFDNSFTILPSLELNLVGPDVGFLQDLTDSPELFYSGEQTLLLGGTASNLGFLDGLEFCIFESFEIQSNTKVILKNIHRRRWGSNKLNSITTTTRAVIFNINKIAKFPADEINFPIPDIRIGAIKTQPITSEGSLDIASSPFGAGYITNFDNSKKHISYPGLITAAFADTGIPGWKTGADFTIKLGYLDNQPIGEGAGDQPAGAAVSKSPIQGFFQYKITQVGQSTALAEGKMHEQADQPTTDVVPEFFVSNATLVTLFSGEPTSFDFVVEFHSNKAGEAQLDFRQTFTRF